MNPPEIKVSIENGIDEFARACLSNIDLVKKEDRLKILRAYFAEAIRSAGDAMATGAKRGVEQAALLTVDPEYFERRQQRRARRLRRRSIEQQEMDQKAKGIVQ